MVTALFSSISQTLLKAFSEANIFISAVNPKLVKGMGENTLRTIKTDPADSRKIAKYALDNWAELRQYSSMDDTRTQLKALNSQYSFILKQRTAAKANLISLLDNTYPGVNKLFDSPARDDGSEKWVDYAYSFWHADCVRKIGLKAFSERYSAFCKKHHYCVRKNKAQELFEASKELVTVFPKDSTYKLLIQQQINQVNLLSGQLAAIRRHGLHAGHSAAFVGDELLGLGVHIQHYILAVDGFRQSVDDGVGGEAVAVRAHHEQLAAGGMIRIRRFGGVLGIRGIGRRFRRGF